MGNLYVRFLFGAGVMVFLFLFVSPTYAGCQEDFNVCGEAAPAKCATGSTTEKLACMKTQIKSCGDTQNACMAAVKEIQNADCEAAFTDCSAKGSDICAFFNLGVGSPELASCLSNHDQNCNENKQACFLAKAGSGTCQDKYNACSANRDLACKALHSEGTPEFDTCMTVTQESCVKTKNDCEVGENESGDDGGVDPDVNFSGLINPLGGSASDPEGITNIPQLVGKIISVGLGMLGSIALLFFVYGGLLWMTSRGDQTQIQQGSKTLLWAGLGIAFVFSSFALVTFIISAIGA